MWPAFPTADYYGNSAPRGGEQSAMDLSRVMRRGDRPRVVPTFTKHRLTGAVSSFTPAASSPVHCRFPEDLHASIGLRMREAVDP